MAADNLNAWRMSWMIGLLELSAGENEKLELISGSNCGIAVKDFF